MARSAQLARLEKRLLAIPNAVKEAVHPALTRSGEELRSAMQGLAPKDTGALIESITVTPPGGTTPPYSPPGGSTTVPDNQVMITVGNSDVRYPHLVEYGTRHAPAQPFFWPAFRLLKKRLENRIKRAIRRAVKEGWNS